MAGGQRDRQLRRARAERIRAAQQRAAQRRKRFIGAGAVAVTLGLIAVLALAFTGGDDDRTDVATSDPTTPTTTGDATTTIAPAAGSAAGKPCVKAAAPLPAGAPEVPVKEGPAPVKLLMEDLVAGTGAIVPPEATVTVNYIGVACSTGKVFDTSYGGQPATFSLTQVIPGWTQGIPGMKVGGKRLLGIPSAMAYGSAGQGSDIGPDEPLWFVVEVLDTKPA